MTTLPTEKFIRVFLLSLLLTNCAGQTTQSTNGTSETPSKQDDALTIWGREIERAIVDGASPEEATDEALNRIEEIFAQWDR